MDFLIGCRLFLIRANAVPSSHKEDVYSLPREVEISRIIAFLFPVKVLLCGKKTPSPQHNAAFPMFYLGECVLLDSGSPIHNVVLIC